MPGVGEVFPEGSPILREGASSFSATLRILVAKCRPFRAASSGLRAAAGFSAGIPNTIEDGGMPPVENATPIEDSTTWGAGARDLGDSPSGGPVKHVTCGPTFPYSRGKVWTFVDHHA